MSEAIDAASRPKSFGYPRVRSIAEINASVEKNLADMLARPGPLPDLINHPPHYTAHPSGVECIQITEHMGFNVGNAVKYLWRAGLKSAAPLEDMRKARWYIDREIARRERAE
jgi:hypothetical protein